MNREVTGIFGGTFNPVHPAHVELARGIVGCGAVGEVWLTLSPENPLKADRPGATDGDRRDMLEAACSGVEGVSPCFIEFDLPRPSYTINTLRALAAKYPNRDFRLIIGADNWQIFNRWRQPEDIIADFGVVIYPRPGYDVAGPLPKGVTYLADLPVFDISSTEIRSNIADNLQRLAPAVANIIKQRNLYATI